MEITNEFRFGRFVQNEIEMMIDSIYGILQQSDVELRIATGEALSVSLMIQRLPGRISFFYSGYV